VCSVRGEWKEQVQSDDNSRFDRGRLDTKPSGSLSISSHSRYFSSLVIVLADNGTQPKREQHARKNQGGAVRPRHLGPVVQRVVQVMAVVARLDLGNVLQNRRDVQERAGLKESAVGRTEGEGKRRVSPWHRTFCGLGTTQIRPTLGSSLWCKPAPNHLEPQIWHKNVWNLSTMPS